MSNNWLSMITGLGRRELPQTFFRQFAIESLSRLHAFCPQILLRRPFSLFRYAEDEKSSVPNEETELFVFEFTLPAKWVEIAARFDIHETLSWLGFTSCC